MQNPFLKDIDFYKRDLNPLKQSVHQSAFYMSKMSGKTLEECSGFIVDKIKAKQLDGMMDPSVSYFERDEEGDRYQHKTTLNTYIKNIINKKEILVPTFTTYLPPEEKRSILVEFIDINKKIRSIAKKEAAKAKSEKKMDLFIIKNNEQDNRKRYNNSMSGAFLAGGSVVNNPTGHNTLTSITRTVTSISNASNEKIITGNRHYRSATVTLYNIISITSSIDTDNFTKMMSYFNLTYPTVEQTIECVRRSTDIYWNDYKAFKDISDFIEKLEPIERAGFVYISDLYHLRQYNESFVRVMLTKLSRRITDVTFEDPFTLLKQTDELVIDYVHQICMSIVEGIGKDYSKLDIKDVNTLAATACNVINTVKEYKLLIDNLFLTRNIPASTAFIPSMVRRTVTTSDTDSTMFALDEWVIWYFGSLIFSDEGFAVAGSVMYIATQSMAHILALFSANMSVPKEKMFTLAMKPEFVFPLHCQTSVAKHYFASKAVKEGSVYSEHEYEIKGVHLKNSAAPKELIEDSQSKMIDIMNTIYSGKKISINQMLTRVADIERKIHDSLMNGEVQYFKSSKIKDNEAYVKDEESSPYQHYILWNEVFKAKYGAIETPPFSVIKIPTILKNKTAVKNWIDSISDKEIALKMSAWFTRKNKNNLPTMYLPKAYVGAFGVPSEIKSIIAIDRIVLDLTNTDRMVLETLGYYPKQNMPIHKLGY